MPITLPKKSDDVPAHGKSVCNKEAKAKEMKGADRKKFMSECLKGDAKSATPAVPATPATPAKPADKKIISLRGAIAALLLYDPRQ